MRGALPLLLALLALALLWHLSLGARSLSWPEIARALLTPDPASPGHAALRELRLPRALAAIIAGAALAVAGGVLQSLTRNPLAEPATLGLAAGAASAVVLGMGLTGGAALVDWRPAIAGLGALAAAALVGALTLAAPPARRQATLLLAGASVSAGLLALDSAAFLLWPESFRALRLWLAGSLVGVDAARVAASAPVALAGIALALALTPALRLISLGEEVARSLGLAVGRMQALALLSVLACTAAAITLAGPLAFVGLVVPHAMRLLAPRHPLPLALCAVAGALLLLLADLAARLALAPTELATGLVTALIGAPVFLALVRARA
ncbi:MAG: iron chelate uptake ABC transporter family permease subunit [Gemmobacter sp.]|uniref:iron chelate uptake ABC transporter family permease subunit n=1 Tax=Gemmobacter sp. TaxID=1898957 RepID=UPI001A596970|nr:iron chelate uptake ABC transporter family permease subunit [Gemmobacter sp.]MBL8560650.1 iron chelate uptake ABC transporter family permease subunit [Gemmobacter sp.]